MNTVLKEAGKSPKWEGSVFSGGKDRRSEVTLKFNIHEK